MLLSIAKEKQQIACEIGILKQVRYKLNNQLRHFKQVHKIPLLIKGVTKVFESADRISNYDPKNGNLQELKCFISETQTSIAEVQSKMRAIGVLAESNITEGRFLQVSVIIFGCVSKIYACLDAVNKKISTINKVVSKVAPKKL